MKKSTLITFMLAFVMVNLWADDDFYCRSPMAVVRTMGTGYTMGFVRSKVPAGLNGVALQPGQCGWRSSPMKDAEPSSLIVMAQPLIDPGNVASLGASIKFLHISNTLMSFAFADNLILAFKGKVDGSSISRVSSSETIAVFPFKQN